MRAHRLPKNELDDLATRILRGEVYIAAEGPALEHSFGFMLMMVNSDEPLTQSQIASIGACYEDMAKALPRAINGYPMFVSMKILHRDDVEPLNKLLTKKHRAMTGETRWKRGLRWFGLLPQQELT